MNIEEETAYILSLINRLTREQKDELIIYLEELVGGR